jgi:hypothetical protein
MVEMAKKRNRAHAGKARFIASSVEHADLGDESYDKIFAVHVAALHRPGKALEISSRLAPAGSLYLFSQAPGWEDAGSGRGIRRRARQGAGGRGTRARRRAGGPGAFGRGGREEAAEQMNFRSPGRPSS